ncbi:MAG TPA: TIGR03618 family F420-dependent PPOX class oxidoreductase [Acidimicrobiales bacterium]|nr:TIGR03618 family F420-dependent PPOX class oxidoreductase [Acidimicrobiales bacterium]
MSRRDLIKMTEPELDAFLHERQVMNVATLLPDGRPHLVAMWYGFLDGAPAFWTYGRSQKIVNLRRDPRVTCLVEDGDTYDQLRGAELIGTGRIVEDRDACAEVGRSVYERYTGPVDETAESVLAVMGAKRVVVVVDVDQAVTWDHRKLAGRY